MLDQISELRSDFLRTISALKVDQTEQMRKLTQRVSVGVTPGNQQAAASTLRDDKFEGKTQDIHSLVRTLFKAQEPIANITSWLALMETLPYEQMEYRHSQIREAHPKTFTDVFQKKIAPWLESDSALYWLSGKPGSGKSTLMKYLVEHPETRTSLCKSFGGQEPVIASYYFWINGTELQRSQDGLLRSLLYEICRQYPDLIELAVPEALRSIELCIRSGKPTQYSWRRNEILAAYRRLAESANVRTRLCFFIDGLDEFRGDHDDLIQIITHLKDIGIKMCVASRPWNIFEQAFGATRECKLYLQDVNKPDIELYVNDTLRQRRDFKKLSIRTTDAKEIVKEIIEKSQGVFLWVFLVVRSLIEGIRNQDRLSQLQKRLREFPNDLEDFFGHIFRSIGPFYRTQTSKMFQVALHSKVVLSPLFYWFLDEEEDRPDNSALIPAGQIQIQEYNDRVDQMKVRINGRCMGLMEVIIDPRKKNEHKVDFLHRTVKDFLMTTRARDILASWQPPDFDADLYICMGALAEFKCVISAGIYTSSAVEETFALILSSAKRLRGELRKSALLYLHEAFCTASHSPPWASNAKTDHGMPMPKNFMQVAVSCDVTELVGKTTWQLHPGFPLTDLLECTKSVEMFRILVECNDGKPSFCLEFKIQEKLAMHINMRDNSHEELFAQIARILETLWFETNEDGRFSIHLHDALRTTLNSLELGELYRLSERHRQSYLTAQTLMRFSFFDGSGLRYRSRRSIDRVVQRTSELLQSTFGKAHRIKGQNENP